MKNFRNNFYFCIANSQRFIAKWIKGKQKISENLVGDDIRKFA
jgi:hypothetical protein